MAKGGEEPVYDPQQNTMIEECHVTEKPPAKKSSDHIGQSYKVFSLLDTELQALAINLN